MKKTHTVAGNRKVTHTAWCITQCPCFKPELTVWWFLTGKKYWCVGKSKEYGNWWY
jgi:hypothetical protein